MKRKLYIFTLILLLVTSLSVLFACNGFSNSSSSSGENGDGSDITHVHTFTYTDCDDGYHYKECTSCDYSLKEEHSYASWTTVTPATTSSQGVKQASCFCGVKKTKVIPTVIQNTQTVSLYAINDFHGKVERIAQFGTYLKELKQKSNTVLLNSGDMFQGSLASNYNYGSLLTDCMDNIGFDSFTYGNHEFDWGLDVMRALSQKSTTPFLGANIYNWDAETREWGDFASDLAREYTTVTLESGVKVGIIGVIGKDQITSISSNLVQTIGFKDPEEIIPPLAEKLRDEEGCHAVVVSLHAPQDALVGTEVEKYVDAVFCGHSHKKEKTINNGVPYVQGGSYGSNVSKITLRVSNNSVSCNYYDNISYSSSWKEDAEIKAIVDEYAKETDALAVTELAVASAKLDRYSSMPTLVCRAIAEYAMDCGYDVDIAVCNYARSHINGGTITYEKLYNAIPFDNIVYVAEVSGRDLINSAKNNYVWRINGDAFNDNGVYKVAIIDYVLFHQDADREYNYFPSAFQNGRQPIALSRKDGKFYNYREITRDFLLEAKNVDVSEYDIESNARANRDRLTQAVTFDDDYYSSSAQNVSLFLLPTAFADKYRFAA